MNKLSVAGGLALVLGAAPLWAQQPPADEQAYDDQATAREADERTADEQEADRPQPRRKLRVLRDPYDIASFYRSRQGSGAIFSYDPRSERYPIAGYYRNRQASPWSGAGFWENGYADRRGQAGFNVGFRRSIGENGDLFLFAPTFLSPLGPLSGLLLFDLDR